MSELKLRPPKGWEMTPVLSHMGRQDKAQIGQPPRDRERGSALAALCKQDGRLGRRLKRKLLGRRRPDVTHLSFGRDFAGKARSGLPVSRL